MPFDVNNQADAVRALTAQINATNAQNILQAEKQMAFQSSSNAKAMQFSADQAALNRKWQEEMSNTAHQREVKDLIAAGLNPVLSANSGASTPSGSTASGVNSAGSLANIESGASAMSSLFNSYVNSAASMYSADTSAKAAVQTAVINSEASKFIAEHYPNSFAGIIGRLAEGLTGGLTSAGKSIGEGLANMFKGFDFKFDFGNSGKPWSYGSADGRGRDSANGSQKYFDDYERPHEPTYLQK